MNENAVSVSSQAFIGKIDNAITSIQEMQSALQVLRMAHDLNKSFMLIDLQASTKIIRIR